MTRFAMILIFLSVLRQVTASGELVVLSSPESLQWLSESTITQDILNEIVSAAFGLTVPESSWDGLRIVNPFAVPKYLLLIIVEGLPTLNHRTESGFFPRFRITSERKSSGDAIFSAPAFTASTLMKRFQRLPGAPGVVSIYVEYGDEPELQIKDRYSRMLCDDHRRFLRELEAIRNLKTQVLNGSLAGAVLIHCRSLHALVDTLGPQNGTVKLAAQELWNVARALSQVFTSMHKDSLSLLLSRVVPHETDGSNVPYEDARFFAKLARTARDTVHLGSESSAQIKVIRYRSNGEASYDITLKTRGKPRSKAQSRPALRDDHVDPVPVAAADDDDDDPKESEDLGDPHTPVDHRDVDQDSAAIFNIVSWFCTAMLFSILGIVHVFMALDPGRDSVVYRMTEPRGKKNF